MSDSNQKPRNPAEISMPTRPQVSAATVAASSSAQAGDTGEITEPNAPRELSPIAKQALAEAEARRSAATTKPKEFDQPAELGGRQGPDPVRYGDWENGGIASDF
jgi:hypothetical protein